MRKKKTKEQANEPVGIGKKVKRAGKSTVCWVLSLFFFIASMAFMPSASSIFFFIAGLLLLPVGKLQAVWQRVLPKSIKRVLCVVVAVAAFVIAPTTDATTPSTLPENDYSAIVDTLVKESNKATNNETLKDVPSSAEEETTEQDDNSASADAETEKKDEVIVQTLPTSDLAEDSSFEIHFLDVGQADAALVLCDDAAMLIDGGNSEDSSLIYSYLKSHGVDHLDYIVVTHGHEDHVGGVSGALNYATVGTAYCSVNSYDSEAFRDFVKYLGKQDKKIEIPSVGDSFSLGNATVQIIGVDSQATDHNNTSIVLRITYGDTSFLFTGDAEREAEQAILSSGVSIASTVLKVGHHGSENSTTYPFLREIMPSYAVISVGEDNSYGHPTEDALSRLRDADVKVYRTDLQGHIVCTSDGKEVSFSVSKNANADTLAPQESQSHGATTAPVVPVAPSVEQETTQSDDSSEPTGIDYVGNKNSDVFHYASCGSVKKMSEKNKFYFTGTREEMIAMGYKPCGNCHP